MSLLNNLRQQALNKQAEEETAARKQADLQLFYRQHTQPRLLRLYRNLHELVTHLNYLEHEIWVDYPLSPAGHRVPMRQMDYKVEIDSLENTQNIALYAWCRGKLELLYQLSDPVQIDKHVEYFKHYNIKHQSRAYKNANHQVVGADITIKTELPIRVQFDADLPNQCIKLTLLNLPALGTRVLRLNPQALDDQFCDDLGRFILREKDEFLSLDISDEEKQRIRNLVEKEQRLREWELKRAQE
jgi:hypothetical protein